jgi:hypothetical protein
VAGKPLKKEMLLLWHKKGSQKPRSFRPLGILPILEILTVHLYSFYQVSMIKSTFLKLRRPQNCSMKTMEQISNGTRSHSPMYFLLILRMSAKRAVTVLVLSFAITVSIQQEKSLASCSSKSLGPVWSLGTHDWEKNGYFRKFNQWEIMPEWGSGLKKYGYIYYPETCYFESCHIHFHLHGCGGQGRWIVDES